VAAQQFRAWPVRQNPFGPETLLVRRARNMVDEDLEPLMPRRLRRLESRIPRFGWPESGDFDWRVADRMVTVWTRPPGSSRWIEYETDRGGHFLTVPAEATASANRQPAIPQQPALCKPPAHAASSHQFYIRWKTPSHRANTPA